VANSLCAPSQVWPPWGQTTEAGAGPGAKPLNSWAGEATRISSARVGARSCARARHLGSGAGATRCHAGACATAGSAQARQGHSLAPMRRVPGGASPQWPSCCRSPIRSARARNSRSSGQRRCLVGTGPGLSRASAGASLQDRPTWWQPWRPCRGRPALPNRGSRLFDSFRSAGQPAQPEPGGFSGATFRRAVVTKAPHRPPVARMCGASHPARLRRQTGRRFGGEKWFAACCACSVARRGSVNSTEPLAVGFPGRRRAAGLL